MFHLIWVHIHQNEKVVWYASQTYTVSNGVKQGGVLCLIAQFHKIAKYTNKLN